MFQAGYFILFAALTVIVNAQENPSFISAVDQEPAAPVLLRRESKQDDSPPPALRRPASSGGSWGSLLSGLLGSVTRTATVEECPGRCVHKFASLMCDSVREDVQCPNSMRCCVETSGGMPPPPGSAASKQDDSSTSNSEEEQDEEEEEEISLNDDGEVKEEKKKKKRRRKKPKTTTLEPTTTTEETTTTTTTTESTAATTVLQKDDEYEGDYEYTSPGNTSSEASRFLINHNDNNSSFKLVNGGIGNGNDRIIVNIFLSVMPCFLFFF